LAVFRKYSATGMLRPTDILNFVSYWLVVIGVGNQLRPASDKVHYLTKQKPIENRTLLTSHHYLTPTG